MDGGGLLLALQPLGCDAGREEEQHSAECRQLLSDWAASPLSGRTTHVHALYCSLVVGCLSGLTTVTQLDKKRLGQIPPLPTAGPSPLSPPLCKRPRVDDTCNYNLTASDLVLVLDDGTRVPANRECVVGGDGGRALVGGSEYFRGLLTGGFGEAQTEEPIRIGDVSSEMLLPVLHFLHGCRLVQGGGALGCVQGQVPDSLAEGGGTQGSRRCRVLDRLLSPIETQEVPFQDSPLGQAMVGASRFLVPDLQGALEELSVTLLLTCGRQTPQSAEENLAARTSELELMEISAGEKVCGGQAPSPAAAPGGGGGGGGASTSTDTGTLLLDPAGPEGAEAPPALSRLLPHLYWFSQRHSYAALGQACLSLLLGGQGHRGEVLQRLAREVDCVEDLRRDLLRLAAADLS